MLLIAGGLAAQETNEGILDLVLQLSGYYPAVGDRASVQFVYNGDTTDMQIGWNEVHEGGTLLVRSETLDMQRSVSMTIDDEPTALTNGEWVYEDFDAQMVVELTFSGPSAVMQIDEAEKIVVAANATHQVISLTNGYNVVPASDYHISAAAEQYLLAGVWLNKDELTYEPTELSWEADLSANDTLRIAADYEELGYMLMISDTSALQTIKSVGQDIVMEPHPFDPQYIIAYVEAGFACNVVVKPGYTAMLDYEPVPNTFTFYPSDDAVLDITAVDVPADTTTTGGGGSGSIAEGFVASTFEDITVDATCQLYRGEDLTTAGNNVWTDGTQQFTTYVDASLAPSRYFYYGSIVSALHDTTYKANYKAGYDMKAICGHAAEGNQYLVWYGDYRATPISLTVPSMLTGMYVTNTTLVKNDIYRGDPYDNVDPFTTGDWMMLTVTGKLQGATTGSVDIYLADWRDAADPKYIFEWMWLDLTPLGNVDQIVFELTSSRNTQFNTFPAPYFCLDNLGGTAPATPGDYRHLGTPTALDDVLLQKASKTIENGQIVIIRNGKKYGIDGRAIQ